MTHILIEKLIANPVNGFNQMRCFSPTLEGILMESNRALVSITDTDPQLQVQAIADLITVGCRSRSRTIHVNKPKTSFWFSDPGGESFGLYYLPNMGVMNRFHLWNLIPAGSPGLETSLASPSSSGWRFGSWAQPLHICFTTFDKAVEYFLEFRGSCVSASTIAPEALLMKQGLDFTFDDGLKVEDLPQWAKISELFGSNKADVPPDMPTHYLAIQECDGQSPSLTLFSPTGF